MRVWRNSWLWWPLTGFAWNKLPNLMFLFFSVAIVVVVDIFFCGWHVWAPIGYERGTSEDREGKGDRQREWIRHRMADQYWNAKQKKMPIYIYLSISFFIFPFSVSKNECLGTWIGMEKVLQFSLPTSGLQHQSDCDSGEYSTHIPYSYTYEKKESIRAHESLH